MKNLRNLKKLLFVCSAPVALTFTTAQAATNNFDGGDDGTGTDWHTADNWSAGYLPITGDKNYITADAIYTTGTTTFDRGDWNIGKSSAGTLTMNGGTITTNIGVIIGQQRSGSLTINTGATYNNNGKFYVGNGPGGNGTVNLDGGTLAVAASTDDTVFGREGGTGLLSITAGTATFSNLLTMSNGSIVFSNDSSGSLSIVGADLTYYSNLYTAGNLSRTGGTGTFATDFNVSGTTLTAVPEPGTYAMIGGILAFAYVMLRRRRL